MQHLTQSIAHSAQTRGPAALSSHHTWVGTAAHSLPGSHCFSCHRSWEESTGCLVHRKLCSTALYIWVLCPATHFYLLLSCMFALWATDTAIRLITSV